MTQRITEMQDKWLTALESGEYAQATDQLKSGDAYCCLGVACQLLDPDGWEFDDFYLYDDHGKDLEGGGDGKADDNEMPYRVVEAFGFHATDGSFKGHVSAQAANDHFELIEGYDGATTLIGLNDDAQATFPQIAAFVRAHPEVVFVVPDDGSKTPAVTWT
jgi:hypothetical protein